MTVRQLHPDWPPTETAHEPYRIDGPAGDLAYAVDYSGADFGTATGPSQRAEPFVLAEIARVARYRIAYNETYYGWDEQAPPDAENTSLWRPDNQVDGSELDMVLVGQLFDGRWFSLVAGNDYTGWGCAGDSADFRIGDTEAQVVEFGLDQAGRRALGYEATP